MLTVIISIELQFGALPSNTSTASAQGTLYTEYNLIYPPVLTCILLFFPGHFKVSSLPFLLPNCPPASTKHLQSQNQSFSSTLLLSFLSLKEEPSHNSSPSSPVTIQRPSAPLNLPNEKTLHSL